MARFGKARNEKAVNPEFTEACRRFKTQQNWGTGIRTPTKWFRAIRATFTQFPKRPVILHDLSQFCKPGESGKDDCKVKPMVGCLP